MSRKVSEVCDMGIYLNPDAQGFLISRNSKPYVDKSMMIELLNRVLDTEKRFVCVSRPRRFGKTMATHMIAAYYTKNLDGDQLFNGLKIHNCIDFDRFRNRYDVIKVNIQEFLSRTRSMDQLLDRIRRSLLRELFREYPDVDYFDRDDLVECMKDVNSETGSRFVVIIDEWDCIFREYPKETDGQRTYLDFLRDFLKDRAYIALTYMTGILPIKKYGTHSALNMFDEYSMENPGNMAEFTGFTEEEVTGLCDKYGVDLDECRKWYDGYTFLKCRHIYNPKSIDAAVTTGIFDDYWNKTETYEALKTYIDMNFDGLRDSVIAMLAGGRQQINTGSFQNDMTSLSSADDVLTLLIHLGYLGYDFSRKEVFIPNKEIAGEFVTATTAQHAWDEVARAVRKSEELLSATINGEEEKVAAYIEKAHLETSHLQYNDENALSYTISLAYYAARQYYTVVRELPSGKGFADLVFVPRKKYQDKPAMLVELKWDHSAQTAPNQILDKRYPESLEEYKGNMLLIGVSYDKKTRKHECRIVRG